MNLYELAKSWNDLLSMMDEIPEDALRDTLEGIEGEFDEKADNIACVIKQLTAESEAIQEEIKSLESRRKAKNQKAEFLRMYLKQQMTSIGKTKVESARNYIRISKSSPKLVLGQAFMDWAKESRRVDLLTHPEPAPDKTAIKKAIQDGAIIPFATLEDGMSLTIK